MALSYRNESDLQRFHQAIEMKSSFHPSGHASVPLRYACRVIPYHPNALTPFLVLHAHKHPSLRKRSRSSSQAYAFAPPDVIMATGTTACSSKTTRQLAQGVKPSSAEEKTSCIMDRTHLSKVINRTTLRTELSGAGILSLVPILSMDGC